MISYQSVFPEVAAVIRETMSLDDSEPLGPGQLLFYDLNFTSLDLLDMLFRLEQRFDIAIPEGTLYQLARGELPESEFAIDSVLTALGRDRLMSLLHDSPPRIFPARIHTTTLPRYCTVGAICRLVESRLAESTHVRTDAVAGN